MNFLVWTAVVLCSLYLSYGVLFYGVKHSLSQLAIDWNQKLFTVFMWIQTLLITPKMFEMTPESIQWIVFFILVGLVFLGGTGIITKSEEICHMIGAAVACGFGLVWLGFLNPLLLLIPVFVTVGHGIKAWQWGGEIGLIIAIYLTLLM